MVDDNILTEEDKKVACEVVPCWMITNKTPQQFRGTKDMIKDELIKRDVAKIDVGLELTIRTSSLR